jgi:hypothetical protein
VNIMHKGTGKILSAAILLASLAAPAAVSQSATAAPAPVSRQACPAGPAVTVTTVGLSGIAGIFASYAHSHPQNSTTDWIGGDTDYSVTLPGGRHLWDFTDAQLGTIAQGTDAILTSGTAHNVAVIENPGSGPITATLHSSKVYAGGGHWYLGWIPEPARAANTALHTPFYNPLAMEVESAKPDSTTEVLRVTGIFGGYSVNSENFVATFSLPGLRLEQVVTFPAPQQATDDLGITWGDALIQQGGWTYVYGRNNPQTTTNPDNFVASAYLARVPSGDLNVPAKWQYFTGLTGTSPQWASGPGAPAEARPIIADGGTYPCERGVVPSGAGYSAARLGTAYYVFTRDPNAIGSLTGYSATRPWGPYSGPDEQDQAQGGFGFYTPPVPAGAGTCQDGCTYGPHIQADYPDSGGGWLLSYDVNSSTLAARSANASLYWPRYLRIHVNPAPAGS